MESVSLFRRPWFIVTGVILILGALYYWLLFTAGSDAVPYSFLSDFILALGILTLIVLIIFTVNISSTTSTTSKGMLRSGITLIVLFLWLALHAPFFIPGSGRTPLRAILVDLDLMLVSLLLILGLIAQFVLPVSGSSDRLAVIRRLLGFGLSERGPVTYIREGKSIEAHEESKRLGLGVFLVDSASGAVLRTDIAFTRAIGPGVTFTTSGERRAAALDLRPQIRDLHGQIPTAGTQMETEGLTTAAITKDGIPVSVDLTIIFGLEPGHPESKYQVSPNQRSPFVLNPEAASRAVYGHMYGESGDLPWTDLPILLATDVWREMVKEVDLKDLIHYDPNQPMPLVGLQQKIVSRLRRDGTAGSQTQPTSREAELLKSRGIRVLNVRLTNLRLPEGVQRERTRKWQEDWAGAVGDKLADALTDVQQEEQRGEAMASEALLQKLTGGLLQDLQRGKQPLVRDTLDSLVQDAIQIATRDDFLAKEGTILKQLNTLQEDLRRLDPNGEEKGSEGPS